MESPATLEGTAREQIRTCNYPPQARKKQGAVFPPSDSRPCASTDLSKPALFLSEIGFCDLLSVIFFLSSSEVVNSPNKDDSVMVRSVCRPFTVGCYAFEAEFHTHGGVEDAMSSENFNCRTSKTSCKQLAISLQSWLSPFWLLLMKQTDV